MANKLVKPCMMPHLPGTFLDESIRQMRWERCDGPIPSQLKKWQSEYPGVDLPNWFLAKRPDGFIRCAVGREPVGTPEQWKIDGIAKWHISISHVPRMPWCWGDEFLRCPTWDEMKFAKFTLVPPEVEMQLCFPPKSAEYLDDFPTCLHLWEV